MCFSRSSDERAVVDASVESAVVVRAFLLGEGSATVVVASASASSWARFFEDLDVD